MKLTVKGKQIDVGTALGAHVDDSLSAIAGKYFRQPIEASVVFSREAHLFRADISVHAGRNIQLQSTATGDDAYAAFDVAAGRIAKRLRRHKRWLVDRGREAAEPAQPLPAQSYVLDAEAEPDAAEDGEGRPVVIAEMATGIESLTVSEAVMRLDLGDMPALMFRNPAHGGLNMVYRRPDGHIGWVDPRGARDAGS